MLLIFAQPWSTAQERTRRHLVSVLVRRAVWSMGYSLDLSFQEFSCEIRYAISQAPPSHSRDDRGGGGGGQRKERLKLMFTASAY